jgi:arginase
MNTRRYEIIGAAFDLGSAKPGCAKAPSSLRENGLASRLRWLRQRGVCVTDGGDVEGPSNGDSGARPKNLPQLLSFAEKLMARLGQSYESGRVPVVIGGDHSISVPSVSAAACFLKATCGADAELGLVWVDAHPDLETLQTTPSGDLHGMSVAHLLGYGAKELSHLGGFGPKLSPRGLIFIGLRDVLAEEKAIIDEHGITAFTANDVEKLGIAEVCERAFAFMSDETSGFVLSFDVDACDPSEAPGVQYPERGGLTYREASIIMECAARAPNVVSLELAEVNPSIDKSLRTTELALALLGSALGGPVLGAEGLSPCSS